MTRRIAAITMLVLCAAALGADEILYQVDLIPSGKLVSRDAPVLKGTNYLFHQFPTGTLISVRQSTVKSISKMTPKAAADVNPRTKLVPIGDLAMQGPKQSGSSGRRATVIDRARSAASDANTGTAGRTTYRD
jgi:hypothetical protein